MNIALTLFLIDPLAPYILKISILESIFYPLARTPYSLLHSKQQPTAPLDTTTHYSTRNYNPLLHSKRQPDTPLETTTRYSNQILQTTTPIPPVISISHFKHFLMIDSYQNDLESIFDSIQSKINHTKQSSDFKENRKVVRRCQNDLKHAENIIRQVRFYTYSTCFVLWLGSSNFISGCC